MVNTGTLSAAREPVGVVGAFTAWNFPAALPARKLAPALVAGCPVVLRPSSQTPGVAMLTSAKPACRTGQCAGARQRQRHGPVGLRLHPLARAGPTQLLGTEIGHGGDQFLRACRLRGAVRRHQLFRAWAAKAGSRASATISTPNWRKSFSEGQDHAKQAQGYLGRGPAGSERLVLGRQSVHR